MDRFFEALGCIAGIAFLLFGIFQIYAAYLGLTDAIGLGWGIAALAVGFFFETSIPVIIGAYLCATNVWGWHWALSALFAAPGLALAIPAVTAEIFASVKRRVR